MSNSFAPQPLKALTNTTPLISVVVATYNGERFIKEQIDSIINQTYKYIEIIIVDDCSTDNTANILKDYSNKYDNIKVHINNTNLGYIKNFEKGLSFATGELIAPSDQDDIWYTDKLEFLLHHINNNPIIYCDSELINDQNIANGKKLSDIKRLATYTTAINYSIGNAAAGHAMLIRKEVIDSCFPFPNMIPHDYWIGFIATFYGHVEYVNKVFIRYRQHTANVFGVGKKKGGINSKKKKKEDYETLKIKAIERVNILYNNCPDNLSTEKLFFQKLATYYKDQHILNRFNKVLLFLKNRKEMMAFKNRSEIRKILFCLKMFFKTV